MDFHFKFVKKLKMCAQFKIKTKTKQKQKQNKKYDFN